MNEDHYRRLERMYASARVNEYFAPVLTVGDGTASVEIAVRPDFFHAAHAVHGAIYFKALDDAAFFAANSLIEDVFVLTVTYNIYLLRPISEGIMRATGRVVHRSRQLLIAEAELRDDRERTIARGSGSFMRSAIPLNADVGYL